MPERKKESELEINQDLDFQEKEWKFERWGWGVITLILLAALLGLLGPGPISDRTISGGSLTVHFHQYERTFSPSSFQVELDSNSVQNGKAILSISLNYADFYEVNNIVPEPESVQLGADRLVYQFQVLSENQPP